MSRRRSIGLSAVLLLTLTTGRGADKAQGAEANPEVGIAVWDTVKPAAHMIAPERLTARNGWAQVATGETAAAFQGDAVLGNGRILAVVRKQAASVEVYALVKSGAISRVRLILLTAEGEPAARLGRAALVENSRAAACLEVSYQTGKGTKIAARFRLKRGEIHLETEARAGTARMRMECPSRYVVLPDLFADDIILDPAKVGADSAEVPSDNLLLHLTGTGDSIAMCVFDNKDQDARISFSGQGDKRSIAGSEIDFGKGRKIWAALLEAPHIWHSFQVAAVDAGAVKRLDWTMPFSATWRCDFTRDNGLISSWEMLRWDKDAYRKPSITGNNEERLDARDRVRWITFLGKFRYPCWIDAKGEGYVEPIKHSELRFQGPALVYPIGRWRQTTPLDAYTMVDVLRSTLGVGPCEYILDLEGQKQEYKGAATGAVLDLHKGMYSRKE